MNDGEAEETPVPPSRRFLAALAILLVALAILITWPYLGAVVLALLVAFILHPVHVRLCPKVRWPSLSAALLLLLVAAFLVLPFVLVVIQTIDQVRHVVKLFEDPELVRTRITGLLATLGIEGEGAAGTISTVGREIAGAAANMVLPTVRFVFKLLLGLIVFFFVLFFAIRDGPRWIENVKEYLPLPVDDKDNLFEGAKDSIWAIIMGTFVVAALQGLVAGIGWWLFGFPAPLFWGFIIVLVGILPFGAPFLITIPASIIAIIQGDYLSGFGLLIYTVTIVGIVDDVLRPYLIGKRSGVHPALVLVGMLGGVAVFGIAGFLLGPLVFALLEPVLDVWARRRRERLAPNGVAS